MFNWQVKTNVSIAKWACRGRGDGKQGKSSSDWEQVKCSN